MIIEQGVDFAYLAIRAQLRNPIGHFSGSVSIYAALFRYLFLKLVSFVQLNQLAVLSKRPL